MEDISVDFETLLFEAREGVALITLNRPERLNAMNRGQGFADGGLVGGGGGGGVSIAITINAVDARGVRDMLNSRDGKEAIIGVVRRGLAAQPQFRRQVGEVR